MAQRATPTTLQRRAERSEGSERRTTIVVGIDGSETSWSALWWACGEAERLGGRVIAVYVTCLSEATAASAALTAGFDAGAFTTASEMTQAEQAVRLGAEVRRRALDLDVDVEFTHLRGDTADQLMRAAKASGADLIAVGRSTKLRHHLAGSLGRRLTRNRKAPIVVIVP